MPDYVTIPMSEFRALMREIRRGVDVQEEALRVRTTIAALSRRLTVADKTLAQALRASVEATETVVAALAETERRLRDYDQELTPVRPPSRTDIEAAFRNSVEFAQGKKKPGG